MTTDPHESVLDAAYKKALALYQKKPTVEHLKNMTAAEKGLAEYRARTAPFGEKRFSNLTEVLGYLAGEGWKISKTKLYDDAGKIDREKDGAIRASSADRYAELVGLPRIDGSGDEDTAEWIRKEQLNNEILEERKRKLQRENEIEEGKWVLKSEVEQKHTAKLALLLTAVDNFIHGGKMEEAIELVKGDKGLSAELKELMKKGFRGALGEYAKRPEFTVPKQAVAEAEEMITEVDGDTD